MEKGQSAAERLAEAARLMIASATALYQDFQDAHRTIKDAKDKRRAAKG